MPKGMQVLCSHCHSPTELTIEGQPVCLRIFSATMVNIPWSTFKFTLDQQGVYTKVLVA